MEQTGIIVPRTGQMEYQIGLSDFIPDEDLSMSLKGDQIRMTVTNSKFFNLWPFQHKNLTEAIHNTNSRICHMLKNLQPGYGLSPRILKESFNLISAQF